MKTSGFLLLLLLAGLISSCKKEENKPGTIIGTWAITGTLITTTNPDASAPQPGFQAMDVWTISQPNGVFTLESSKGTVSGTPVSNATSQGARFTGQFPIVAGYVWVDFIIETYARADGDLYGTEEFQYWGLYGVGQPMFLGTESWIVEGVAQ